AVRKSGFLTFRALVPRVNHCTKAVKQTYTKLRADHWEHIKDFYGISDRFPHYMNEKQVVIRRKLTICYVQENLYSRSEGTASVCLVKPSIRTAILAGEHTHVLDTGLRVFARVQAAGKLVFRPTEEGLEQMLPFITKRKAQATSADLISMLTVPGNDSKQVALGLERFSEPLQEAAAAVRECSGVGPMLMVLPEPELHEARVRQLPTALPVWLGDKTLTLLIDKHTRDRLVHASQEQ
ncbi:LOW QUALITY PROTEIN: TRNA (cytosine-5-)-methyltransferase NSUN2-like protein, partial [Phytophthora palmivora]